MANLTTEEVFESAVSIVRNLPKEGPVKPSDELKLKLYAYFKQAIYGPNDTAKPRFYQIVDQYKWDAWKKLGDMPKEEAMANYIKELKLLMSAIPSEHATPDNNKHFEDVLGKKFYEYWFGEWMGLDANRESTDSSVSMLDETNSLAEGYETPKNQLAPELNDQFGAALLRLRHSVAELGDRVERLETRLNTELTSMRTSTQPAERKSVHWFYIVYPILIYFALDAIRGRNRRDKT